jgi:BRCT domain type II-containing protein
VQKYHVSVQNCVCFGATEKHNRAMAVLVARRNHSPTPDAVPRFTKPQVSVRMCHKVTLSTQASQSSPDKTLNSINQRVSRDIIDLIISSNHRQDAAAVTYPA